MTSVRERLQTYWGEFLMYSFLTLAGILVLVFPPIAVNTILPVWTLVVWSSFFTIGGFPSLIGIIRATPAWKALLPLPASSLLLFAYALFYQFAEDRTRGASLFVGLLFVSFACGLIQRWIEAMRIVRISGGSR